MKKHWYILLLFIALSIVATAQPSRPRVAVVLSGGGAKGVAHISALRVIEQAGIPIDIICGTSMGALIGGLYAIGWNTDELDSLVRTQDWIQLLSDRTDPKDLNMQQRHEQNTYALIRGFDSSSRQSGGGLIRGRNLATLFNRLCIGYLDSISFDSLPIPFACVATDIVNNTELDFRHGYLTQAMRASMAIPGVFTPVRFNEHVLVDGGLRNNYPADIARAMGADIIIGVTVQGEALGPEDLTDAVAILSQIIDINCKNKYDTNIAMSDIVMDVDVSGYSAASFIPEAIDSLLRRGDEAARNHWDELLALRRNNNIDSLPRRSSFTHPVPFPATAETKATTVPPVLRLGFNFNTEEMGAIQISGSLPSRHITIDASARLGNRMAANLELSSPHLPIRTSYAFLRNNLDIYSHGERTFNIKYRRHSATLAPLSFHLKKFILSLSARWDYYDYYGRLLSASYNSLGTTTSGASDPASTAISNFDLHDESYFSYNAIIAHNSENRWYFPTTGIRFTAAYRYITDNLISLDGHAGMSDIFANWRINIPLNQRTTLQPMLYGRLLFANSIPLAYRNVLGAEWFSHHVEQQMPFAGVTHLEYIGSYFAAIQMQAQYRLGRNHYIQLRTAAGYHVDSPRDLSPLPNILGAQLAYFFNTPFGPIGATIGYSSLASYPTLFLTIGNEF